jgi:serine/threonine protein kinase
LSPGQPTQPEVAGAWAVTELPGRGMRVGRFVVTARVAERKHTTILQARDTDGSFVAIKLARTATGSELVEREARLVRAIDPGPVRTLDAVQDGGARFAGTGNVGRQSYFASRWMTGAEARIVAAEARSLPDDDLDLSGDPGSSADPGRGPSPRRELLELVSRLTGTYAALHDRGVIHGQVHPRHVLVDRDGSVSLLDFSLATAAEHAPSAAALKARFNSLSPPEHAESVIAGADLRATAAAEQYSLAGLLYLLITGRLYARLRLERQTLAADIIALPPLAFADHGQPSWPELEAVLSRALAKDPDRRYASVGELRRTLDSITIDEQRPPRTRSPRASGSGPSPLTRVLEAFRQDADADPGVARLEAPTCSINYGGAGVAFTLTRLGKLSGDTTAFEQAERWLASAEAARSAPDAFDDGDELTPQTVGLISPFHNASGLAAVRAYLSQAIGDHASQQAALDAFRRATDGPCANLDLTLGRSSVLLVAALLYAGAQPDWPAAGRLASYGDGLAAGILHDIAQAPMPYYGIAHGSAGIAYAALIWARARSTPPPPEVHDVLELLAAVAEPHGRGAHWPLTPTDEPTGARYWPGWCHGNAGYVFLWNLARDAYGDQRFAELADRAAWLVDAPAGVSNLCCGTAGQVYAALNHYRSTNDERWHARAVGLAERSAAGDALAGDSKTPLSLYKGHAGLALLALELDRPADAAMPLFELEPRTRA